MSRSGTTKIALAMHSDDWAHGYCDAAQEYIRSHGGEIVATTILEHGATDATAQTLQIKASGAQAVMGCLYQPELIVMLRDLQKYQMDAVVVGALGADFDQVVAGISQPRLVGTALLPALSIPGQDRHRATEEVPRHLRQGPQQGGTAQDRRTDQFLLLRCALRDRDGRSFPPRRPEPDARKLGKGGRVTEGFRYRGVGRYRNLPRQPCRPRQRCRPGRNLPRWSHGRQRSSTAQ